MTDLLTANGYTWPTIHPSPMAHQQVTAEFLVRNPRAFCFNDIGSAKTLSCLWAVDFLKRYNKSGKCLIAAPLSTLWKVWDQSIFMNMPFRSCAVLHGSKEKRLKELAKDVDFYIINHEGLDVIANELLARQDIKHVIVDEGAMIKNARTIKWERMWNMAGPSSGRSLWWVTGSPMPRGPEDVWAQGKIINPRLVPKYYTAFRDMMMYRQGLYKWLPRPGWESACYAMLQPSIRFERDECIDLPPCTTQLRKVDMSKKQGRAYAQMWKTLVSDLDSGRITAANEAVKRIKLIQIAAGAVYDGYEVTHWLDCTPKLKELRRTIHEAQNKAIIFVPFRHSIPLLRKNLKKWGFTNAAVYGGVSAGKRNKIFGDFQDGNLETIVAHPKTMAHGLDLTAAHTVIWWAPVGYEVYEQANGRITRPGQKKSQTIVQLSCSPVETEAYKRLENSERLQGMLLDLLVERREG